MRVHHINNLNKVLQVIQEHGIKLVNISSDDIVGGNAKLTLGLIWLIALEFNGQNLVKSQSINGVEKSLLAWARQFTEVHGLLLNDFSNSWSDGRAFLMILHSQIKEMNLMEVLEEPALVRLKLAFDLAHKHFKIEKLLDPEDVYTHKPDNKSIQMYVMCLYHAMEIRESDLKNFLEFNTLNVNSKTKANANEKENEIPNDFQEIPLKKSDEVCLGVAVTDTGAAVNDILEKESISSSKQQQLISTDDKTRPLSTATNASIEISGYQAALEAVLTLLLEDEQILSQEQQIPQSFHSAKIQFHDNEQFMLKLTEHQQYVGEALEEGSNLINEAQKDGGGLSIEDQSEIRQQMVLLNERWETLRLKALDVQSKILGRLADFQTQQIEKLREFLTNIEDRISHMSAIGPTLVEVQQQLQEAHGLKNDLSNQQELVDSLSNMVVIVNDETGNFNDLEDKLSALGERWSHVVKWSDLRMEKLQQYKCISRWLDSREHDLKTMESKDVTDLGSITKRMNDLNYCAKDLLELERYLIDLRQMVAATLQEGDEKGERVLMQLESFEDRLDALKQIVEVQTDRIEQKGFKFGRNRASYDDSRVLRPVDWVDYQMIIKFGDEDDVFEDAAVNAAQQEKGLLLKEEAASHIARKKRKLRNTDNFHLLQNKLLEAVNFMENCEERLLGMPLQNLRQQLDSLQNVQQQLTQRLNNANDIRDLYEVCEKEDLSQNLIIEAAKIKQIEEGLQMLKQRVEHLQMQNNYALKKEKLYTSLTGFKLVLADSRDWYQQHATTAAKADLEQRLNDMESLTMEIAEANEASNNFVEDLVEWKEDFQLFYESWTDMKNAIVTLINDKVEETELALNNGNLKALSERIHKEAVVVATLDAMEQQMRKFQNLSEEIENLKTASLQTNVGQDFQEHCSKLMEILKEHILKQITAIENLNHFTKECKAIIDRLKKLEANLKNEDYMHKLSLQQADTAADLDYIMELKSLEVDIFSVRNFSEIIIKNADKEHKQQLSGQIEELNRNFENIQALHKEYLKQRTLVQAKTEEIFERLTQTEKWLNDLEANTPKIPVAEIKNSNELFHIKCKFQALKETCEKESVNFRELNELGGETLLQIDELKSQGVENIDNKYNQLAKKFTRLNAKWTEVTTLVYTKTALLEHISTQLGEFKKFMVSESGYLDRLENKMHSTPENADAEEIIEELDVSLIEQIVLESSITLLLYVVIFF